MIDFLKKKKAYGLKPKQGTKTEIEQEYSRNAAQHGHKTRLIAQMVEDSERLSIEIAGHLEVMKDLSKQITRLPADPTPPGAA